MRLLHNGNCTSIGVVVRARDDNILLCYIITTIMCVPRVYDSLLTPGRRGCVDQTGYCWVYCYGRGKKNDDENKFRSRHRRRIIVITIVVVVVRSAVIRTTLYNIGEQGCGRPQYTASTGPKGFLLTFFFLSKSETYRTT